MKLTLKNLGMLREAEIRLDGLTVITGENDTGKSTVGKLLFALIKAFNNYEQASEKRKSERIFELIEKFYFELRKNIDFSKTPTLQETFNPIKFFKELNNTYRVFIPCHYTQLDNNTIR